MARVVLPASKLKVRKRKKRLTLAVACALTLLFLLGVVVGLSWLPFVRVGTVRVVGAEAVAPSAVEAEVRATLAGRKWHVFANDNIFLYPKDEIAARLYAAFPVLNSVEVRADDFTTLEVAVGHRAPEALWCGESFASTAPCLILDQDGVAYEISAEFSGDVYVSYYGALPGLALPRTYLSPEQFKALSALAAALTAGSDRVEKVWVDNHGDVHVRFTSGFVLLFALGDDGAKVLDRFALAQTSKPFEGRTTADFEYLDLRFGDRLYYKLKAE